MTYGYARCSTTETKQDINRQIRDLKKMGAKEIYWEYESGAKRERPELAKVLRIIRGGDTLVVTEVSRITRSTKQLCEIIDIALQRGIKLLIGAMVIDCAGEMDPMTKGMIQMMGVFAELERSMTIERIKSGLANARAKGVRLGRPRLTADRVPRHVVKHFDLYTQGKLSKTDYARMCGVSRPTLDKYIALLTDNS